MPAYRKKKERNRLSEIDTCKKNDKKEKARKSDGLRWAREETEGCRTTPIVKNQVYRKKGDLYTRRRGCGEDRRFFSSSAQTSTEVVTLSRRY